MQFARLVTMIAMLSVAAASPATAATIRFHFEGTILSMNDQTADASLGSPGGMEGDFGVAVGTLFGGYYTIDADAVDEDPDADEGTYHGPGDHFLSVGSATFDPYAFSQGSLIRILDDTPFGDEHPTDVYQSNFSFRPRDVAEQLSSLWVSTITLRDDSMTALADDSQPILPPDLGDFPDQQTFVVSQGSIKTCHPIPWEECTEARPEYREGNVLLVGEVTSLVAVPEPSTAVLLAAGLAGLAARRRSEAGGGSLGASLDVPHWA